MEIIAVSENPAWFRPVIFMNCTCPDNPVNIQEMFAGSVNVNHIPDLFGSAMEEIKFYIFFIYISL
jgi:hypothetical protein